MSTSLNAIMIGNADTEDYTREESSAFVGRGPKAGHYRRKWAAANTMLKSWSWIAFFTGPWWMMYRRMYVEAVLFSAAAGGFCVLAGLISNALNLFPYAYIFALIPMAAAGLFANDLYLSKFLRIKRRCEYAEGQERLNLLAKKGGTKKAAAWIFTGVVILVCGLTAVVVLLLGKSNEEVPAADGMFPDFDMSGEMPNMDFKPMPGGDIALGEDIDAGFENSTDIEKEPVDTTDEETDEPGDEAGSIEPEQPGDTPVTNSSSGTGTVIEVSTGQTSVSTDSVVVVQPKR